MEVNAKVCPHCGGTMFAAKIIRGCIVNTKENNTYEVIKEHSEKFDIEVFQCLRCMKPVANDDLITGVKCKECGQIVSSSELSEHGLCAICQAQKDRSELANASREDLIRMLLDAERKMKLSSSSVPNVDAEDNEKKESGKTKKATRAKKKAEDEVVSSADIDANSVEESMQEVMNPPEEMPMIAPEQQQIEQQQEAPFPNVTPNAFDPFATHENMPLQNNSTPSQEQIGVNNFDMFEGVAF